MKNGVLSLQFEPRINNKEKNFETVSSLISHFKDKKLDLILLPEFFSTGISHDGFIKLAEYENSSETIKFISSIAKEYNTNICMGTIIEKENDKFYNTSYVINRKGEIEGKYRKIHLFSYLGGHEDEVITKGDKLSTIKLDFATVGLSVCFDIRFPLHFNKLMKMGAEIMLCPNAWCVPSNISKEALNIKKQEMRAFAISRASENLVYFIGSSMNGKLGSGLISCAESVIVSPDAEILAVAQDKNDAIYSEIDLDLVRNYKKTFPVYKID